MQTRGIYDFSENDTPDQTYKKVFAQRVEILKTLQELQGQAMFLKGLSQEQAGLWAHEWRTLQEKLRGIDIVINDWLKLHPQLNVINSMNTLFPAPSLAATPTFFSPTTPWSFHPGTTAEKSVDNQQRLPVKSRR